MEVITSIIMQELEVGRKKLCVGGERKKAD